MAIIITKARSTFKDKISDVWLASQIRGWLKDAYNIEASVRVK